MNHGLRVALQTFLGDASGQVSETNGVGPRQNGAPVAILTGSSTGQLVERLRRDGYTRFQELGIPGSASTPRLIIPIQDSHCARISLNIFTPYDLRRRALKRLLSVIMWMGWTGWARQKVVIASRHPLTIESLVTEVTGELQPVFALSLGNPGRYRKLMIQVMKDNGEVLGYVKLPMTPAAVARVRHEAAMLEHLANFPVVRPYIPRVLFAGECEQGYILFRTGGFSVPAPPEFGSYYEDFLKNLWRIESIEKPGETLVEEVEARWRVAERLLDSGWRDLGKAALMTSRQELKNRSIRCGIMHGDFAPWNTCVSGGSLLVFDWECAEMEAPNQWDIFHFHAHVSRQLNRKNHHQFALDRSNGERALYLLYLLFAVGRVLVDGVPADLSELDYHRRLLTEALSDKLDVSEESFLLRALYSLRSITAEFYNLFIALLL